MNRLFVETSQLNASPAHPGSRTNAALAGVSSRFLRMDRNHYKAGLLKLVVMRKNETMSIPSEGVHDLNNSLHPNNNKDFPSEGSSTSTMLSLTMELCNQGQERD